MSVPFRFGARCRGTGCRTLRCSVRFAGMQVAGCDAMIRMKSGRMVCTVWQSLLVAVLRRFPFRMAAFATACVQWIDK